jgi:hypothetical protein
MEPLDPTMTQPPAAPLSDAVRHCAPFAPVALTRQLSLDAVIRWSGIALIAAVLLSANWIDRVVAPNASYVITILAAVGWVALNTTNTRVFRQLPHLTAMLDHDLGAAEALLAESLDRRPLQRSVRLLLYHRLAVLRHRQRRFAEAAGIAASVLSRRLGRAEPVRANLLLIVAESALECGDLPRAAVALESMGRRPLSLIESVQRLALQTRYDVAAGRDAESLAELERKLPLIELMPAPQCGAVHALLAQAATRTGRIDLADWLRRRAELLATAEQLKA